MWHFRWMAKLFGCSSNKQWRGKEGCKETWHKLGNTGRAPCNLVQYLQSECVEIFSFPFHCTLENFSHICSTFGRATIEFDCLTDWGTAELNRCCASHLVEMRFNQVTVYNALETIERNGNCEKCFPLFDKFFCFCVVKRIFLKSIAKSC